MKSILVLFAHPMLEKSRVHRAWVDAISDLEGVTVRDLYQLYPEFDVDPEVEQKAAEENDILVLQFPIYWYSTPALLKQWQDLVLLHGWAYGSGGEALRGKEMLCAVSMGGRTEMYQHDGFHGITVGELLAPIRQTARLCHMEFLPPFLGHGAFGMTEKDVVESALEYRSVLEALRDEKYNPAHYKDMRNLTVPTGAWFGGDENRERS